MRYFLIDKVTKLVPGERARGIKCVTLTDETLHDHFPDFPILPGALLIEGAAQLAGLLIEATVNGPEGVPRRALLVQIDKAKFKETTGPGDRIEVEARLEQRLDAAARVAIEAAVEGEAGRPGDADVHAEGDRSAAGARAAAPALPALDPRPRPPPRGLLTWARSGAAPRWW